jgi:putative transposase
MKRVRFTEEQMVAILRKADNTPVAQVAKKHKVSEQTISNWRRHFGSWSRSTLSGCVRSNPRTRS